MRTNLINTKIRYPYINNPFGFVLPKKPKVSHKIIDNWDDFTIYEKNLLLEIKNKINFLTKIECEIFIFGSRIKGYWIEDSDFDIGIKNNISREIFDELRKIDFRCKVDLFINQNPESLDKYIIIG